MGRMWENATGERGVAEPAAPKRGPQDGNGRQPVPLAAPAPGASASMLTRCWSMAALMVM